MSLPFVNTIPPLKKHNFNSELATPNSCEFFAMFSNGSSVCNCHVFQRLQTRKSTIVLFVHELGKFVVHQTFENCDAEVLTCFVCCAAKILAAARCFEKL
jgi:hypothetical protein